MITEKEIRDRLEVAKRHPDIAHLILTAPPYPICELCGGTEAPIINGKHLNPNRWCRQKEG